MIDAAIFALVALLIVGAVIYLLWPEKSGKHWRIMRADVGKPLILQRRKCAHALLGCFYWETVEEFETKAEALVAMRETILRENPSLEAEFDAQGREVA